MSAPFGLLAGAVLFWGQQAGLLPIALFMAAALEGARFSARRWDFSRVDFSRVSDASAVLFFGMAVYLYSTRNPSSAFMTLSAWLPLAFFPLLAAQLYSVQGSVDVRALFVFLRDRPLEPRLSADIAYPYVIVCLISAGSANNRTPLFYAGFLAVASFALWRARPKASSTPLWIALIALAGASGYAGQLALHRLQFYLENNAMELVFGGTDVRPDVLEVRTALGHIGELKQSSRIVARVEKPAAGAAPRLLRSASYNSYRDLRWQAYRAPFETFSAPAEQSGERRADEFDVSLSLDAGSGLLALPADARPATFPPTAILRRSRLGAVALEQGPTLVSYRVAPAPARDGPPDERDLQIPEDEAVLLRNIARRLHLDSRRPRESIAALQAFFEGSFNYSLYRAGSAPDSRALDEFLLKTHSGHCEYFATATTLLLRAAGIPARYAVGYSISEYSKLERSFIVRSRHAHAWALAYADGAWRDLDTTPASWTQAESSQAPFWESAQDLWSWAVFSLARAHANRLDSRRALRRLAPLLVALGAWFLRGKIPVACRRGREGGIVLLPGQDSEWYALENALAKDGLGRHPWETPAAWIDRLQSSPGAALDAAALRPLLELHYRYRFDPAGISAPERESLRAQAREALARQRLAV